MTAINDPAGLNAALARLSAQMATDAAINLDAQVEHCPEWRVRDLVVHIGDVQWFWSEILENRVTDRSQIDVGKRAKEHADPVGRFRTESARLVKAFNGADDDEHIWTWFEPLQHVGFARRRQVVEVAMHGWDASNAVGVSRPIPHDVAVLGLVEFVEVMSQEILENAAPRPIQLTCTDGPWSGVLFASSEIAPSLTLDGTASDLLLSVWGRRVVSDLAVAASIAAVDLS
jgi:uncharacterized protein (TIGR03083 family)